MFARISTRKRGDKVYKSLHIVETYRDDYNNVKQRLVANLGPVQQYKPEDVGQIIHGLKRIFEMSDPETGVFDDPTQSLDLGVGFACMAVWDQLGWTKILERQLEKSRYRFDVISNVKTLVTNRLLDPSSKLYILEWMKGVFIPGVKRKAITHSHLLRTMDFLERKKDALELAFAERVMKLFDVKLNVVFYDATSAYFELDGQDEEEGKSTLRRYGYSRDHRKDLPQVVIGLVMTEAGIPLAHHVYPGNRVDKETFMDVVEDVRKRFGVEECVFIGDRGLMTEKNVRLLGGVENYRFIMAHKLRQNNLAKKVIRRVEEEIRAKVKKQRKKGLQEEIIVECEVDGRRFVVSHNEEIAAQTKKTRTRRLMKAQAFIGKVAEKLQRSKRGEGERGRKLTEQGAFVKIHDYLRDRRLSRYFKVWLDKGQEYALSWQADFDARKWEIQIDGKILLETTCRTMSKEEVVERYRELQDVERCFRTLKSSLDLRPMFHRLDQRIRAHAFLCVMALQMQRVMRSRLRERGIKTEPIRALGALSRVRGISATVGDNKYEGITSPDAEQLELFEALEIGKPSLADYAGKTDL
jgi:transposase